MFNAFIMWAQGTTLIVMPDSFNDIVFGEDCVIVNQPHPNFDF